LCRRPTRVATIEINDALWADFCALVYWRWHLNNSE